jgi:hypothetical protein
MDVISKGVRRPLGDRILGRLARALVLTTVLLGAVPALAQVNVPTSMYNNQRVGVNSSESILTPANVNTSTFGKLFSQPVDGYVFAQPLYASNVLIGGSLHNVVYVATQHDSVYAFDADSNTGPNAQPLWRTSFLSPGITSVPSSPSYLNCSDINPEYGVTGTPAIDLATNTMFVVSETLENGGTNYVKKLYALDIRTGAQKPGSPIVIGASVTVPGQSPVVFDSRWQMNRPGLLYYNGVVYIGFGSHCDLSDFRGWVLGYAYNGSNFSQTFVFSTEPSSVNGRWGGIWMGARAADGLGSNLFIALNGHLPDHAADQLRRFDPSHRPVAGSSCAGLFHAGESADMDQHDGDLGGAAYILPNQAGPNLHPLVHKGKDGVIRAVNRDNMY